MKCDHDEFHANKSERLRSFENTVKNIFDEKLKKFGDDCFEKAKNPESITQVQIFDNYGRYYLKSVNNSFKDAFVRFDKEGRHLNNINSKKYLYYTRYILFRTVSSKKKINV